MSRKDDAARLLARSHFEFEPGMQRIFRLTGSAEAESRESEPIKLLEVNEATVATGILPLHFGPMPESGVPYPTVIIAVTPEEFEKVNSHELRLPNNWDLGEEMPRPVLEKAG
ncbi:MAG TPA: hypothetical protein VN641_08270 [Urbifossiella sp.]|nr:hypothetical protein [Urbifossiella sp.]